LSEVFSRQLSEALRVLTGIVRLKNGPEDLPASTSLLLTLILVASGLDALTYAIVPLPEKVNAPLLVGIGVAVTLVWYGALLRFARRPERFNQTLSAIFGFQIVFAPALIFTAWFYFTYHKDPTWQLPAGLLRSVVEIWALVILARILRSATNWPLFACVLLAIANELLSALLMAAVLPDVAATAAAPATTT
jgi:hypothetical protein